MIPGDVKRSHLRMTRWLDEEQTAMNAGVLDITVTLGSELLSEICRMLILDVLHNGVPAS